MKYLFLIALIGIVGSLATALFFMLRTRVDEKSRARKMAWALALRVGISIILFASILLAWKLGYIQPTGIAGGRL
jgi:cytochrome bd-type quinol oxidase subunit 2